MIGGQPPRSGPAVRVRGQGLAVLHAVDRTRRPRSLSFRTEGLMRYDRLPGLLVLCSLLPAGTVRGASGGGPRPDYRNPALPTARRVEDLLARMTLEEKVAQMLCIWNAKRQITDAQGRFDPARAPEWFRVGIGRIERPSDGHGARARGGIHQRDPALGEGEHAPRHPRDLPRGGAARAAGAGGDQLPAGHRPGEHLEPGPGGARLRRGRAGGAGPRRAAGARPGGGRGPRPALGALRGDLRRGPVPGVADGPGGGARLPGGRPDHPGRARDRHAEAHDRARPAGVRDERGPGVPRRADAARRLLLPLRGGGEAGARPQPDAFVQRDRRHPLARQPLDAPRRAAGGVGLRRHHRLGLAGHQPARRPAPGGRGRRRRGAAGAGGHRGRGAPGRRDVSHPGRAGEAGEGARGRDRRRRAAAAAREVRAGPVREPVRGPRPRRRDLRLGGEPAAGPGGGAPGDRAPPEPRRPAPLATPTRCAGWR